MKNKKGISQVVTTLLFILIALGAVLLVWTLVKSLVSENTEQIKVDEACLKFEIDAVTCDITASTVSFKMGNKDPQLPVAGIKLIFEDATGDSETADATVIPALLESRSDVIPALTIGVPVKFSVAGVLTAESGEDKICPASEEIVCQ